MDLKEHRMKNNSFIRHPWELARLNIVKMFISKYYARQEANILDIGTGDGFSLEQISYLFKKNNGFGLDVALTKEELECLNNYFRKQKLNISVVNSSGPIKNFSKENKFDIVCFMDVLEHVKNDIEFLKNNIKDYNLSDNTLFVITVPAFERVFSSHDKFLEHYRRYTKESLQKVLCDADLKILDIGYFFFSLLIIRYFICIIERIFKINKKFKGTANWSYGKLTSILVSKCLMLDFYVTQIIKKLGILIPGLSVYAIAKRDI